MISQSLTMSFYFSCGSIRLKFCFYIFYRVCNRLFIKFTLNFSKSIKTIRIRTPKVSEQRFISRDPQIVLSFPICFKCVKWGSVWLLEEHFFFFFFVVNIIIIFITYCLIVHLNNSQFTGRTQPM